MDALDVSFKLFESFSVDFFSNLSVFLSLVMCLFILNICLINSIIIVLKSLLLVGINRDKSSAEADWDVVLVILSKSKLLDLTGKESSTLFITSFSSLEGIWSVKLSLLSLIGGTFSINVDLLAAVGVKSSFCVRFEWVCWITGIIPSNVCLASFFFL